MKKEDVDNLTKKAREHRLSVPLIISMSRIKDLLKQIEDIKPLLEDPTAEIRLRASAEIRAIHIEITKIHELSQKPFRVTRKAKQYKKKKLLRTDQNMFRPV